MSAEISSSIISPCGLSWQIWSQTSEVLYLHLTPLLFGVGVDVLLGNSARFTISRGKEFCNADYVGIHKTFLPFPLYNSKIRLTKLHNKAHIKLLK